MKNLFIVRHGIYDSSGQLTNLGIEHTNLLGRRLKSKLDCQSIYLTSSPARRAYQSAEILAKCLGISEIEKIPYLCSDVTCEDFYSEFHPGALGKMMKIVEERSGKADNLILMTHQDVCRSFTPYFTEKEFGYETALGTIGNSESIHFDLEKKDVNILSFSNE